MKEEKTKEIKTKNKTLNDSIIDIRVILQSSDLRKSGHNKFAGFDYFELSDFLPMLNKLMQQEGINDRFSIIQNDDGTMTASLLLIKGVESQVYTMPFVLFETPLTYKKDKNGNFIQDKEGNYAQVPSMQDIQYLGALNTYYKRYLYLNAFGITDGEIIDSMNNDDLGKNDVAEKKASPKQVELLSKYYIGDNLTKLLEANKIKNLSDISMKKATEIIGAIMEKENK